MGGSDQISNIHLLCPFCHEMSEYLSGLKYWRWFKNQRFAQAVEWGAARTIGRLYGPEAVLTVSFIEAIELANEHLAYKRGCRVPTLSTEHTFDG
jgi:hypothetical protein